MRGQEHPALRVLQIPRAPGLADGLDRAISGDGKFVDVIRPGVQGVEFVDRLGAAEIGLVDAARHRHHDAQLHAELEGYFGGQPVRAFGQR